MSTLDTSELVVLPADTTRGLIGMCGIFLIAMGAGLLWGVGGFSFALGFVLTFLSVLDEALERITRTRRDSK